MGFTQMFFPKAKNTNDIEQRDLSGNMANYSTGINSQDEQTVVVDLKSVKTIPTVNSCLNKICGSIAQLPIYLYKENQDGSVEKLSDDYRVSMLNGEVNTYLTSFDYKKTLVEQYLMYGKSITYVKRVGNEIEALYPLDSKTVSTEKKIKSNGYEFDLEFKTDSKKFKPYDLIVMFRNTNDGSEGYGLLEEGKNIFSLCLNENEYSKNILSKGALPLGVLKTDSKLSKDVIGRLRASWESLYSGAKNAGKTVILEEGLTYQPLSLKPSELNLNENRKISSQDICTLFDMPTSLVLNDGNFSDEDNLLFLKYCLSPIICAIESALDKTLLLEDEKEQGYYFRFDISELERSTLKERYAYIEKGMKAGVTSINEARASLDLPNIEKDYLLLSLGDIFYNMKTGKIEVPNTGQNIEGSNESEEENLDTGENEDDNENNEDVE